MKEIVIIGVPGSGKSVLLALFMKHLDEAVFVDGNVDNPLWKHLFQGKELKREPFKVSVPLRNFMLCVACGLCAKNCPFKAISEEDLWIDPLECEGCGICAYNCPQRALEIANMQIGEKVLVEEENKLLIYGQLLPGALGGPMLVESLREEARNKNRKFLVSEVFGLGESAWRLAYKAECGIFIINPETPIEIFSRFKSFEVQERYLVFNQSGCDPEREENLIEQAQKDDFKLLARVPWEEKQDLSYLDRAQWMSKYIPLKEFL